MENKPIICVFPCKSPEANDYEFRSEDDLRTWLKTTLVFRNGKYNLRSIGQVPKMPIGSIVLFRIEKAIVGEGVVKKEIGSSEFEDYEGMVQFEPSSLRIYKEPLKVEELEELYERETGEKKSFQSQGYVRIESKDFGIYGEILKRIAREGFY